jgi:hypothetical protein
MIESTTGMVDGAQAPGLSLPLTSLKPEFADPGSGDPGSAGPYGSMGTGPDRNSRPVFAGKAAHAAEAAQSANASAGIALRALPGLDAWSLACRRKTLRGVWRGWLLKSHKSVR